MLKYNFSGDEIVTFVAGLNIDDDIYGFARPTPEIAFNLVPIPSFWGQEEIASAPVGPIIEDSSYFISTYKPYDKYSIYQYYNEEIAFTPPPPMIDDYGWKPPVMAAGLVNKFLIINTEEIVVPPAPTPGSNVFFASRRALIHLR